MRSRARKKCGEAGRKVTRTAVSQAGRRSRCKRRQEAPFLGFEMKNISEGTPQDCWRTPSRWKTLGLLNETWIQFLLAIIIPLIHWYRYMHTRSTTTHSSGPHLNTHIGCCLQSFHIERHAYLSVSRILQQQSLLLRTTHMNSSPQEVSLWSNQGRFFLGTTWLQRCSQVLFRRIEEYGDLENRPARLHQSKKRGWQLLSRPSSFDILGAKLQKRLQEKLWGIVTRKKNY